MSRLVNALLISHQVEKKLKAEEPEKQIELILDALEKVENKGDKIQFADKIFGGQGVDLIRLTNSEIEKAADELERLNVTLTETDVSAVETMNDELQRVQRYGAEASKVFTSSLAPAITATVRETLGLGSGFLNARSAGELMAEGVTKGVGFLGDALQGTGLALSYIDAKLKGVRVQSAKLYEILNGPGKSSRFDLNELRREFLNADNEFKLARQKGLFSDRLKSSFAEAREEAEKLAAEIEAARAAADSGGAADSLPEAPEKLTGKKKTETGLFNTSAEEIERQVDAQIKSEQAAEATLEEARKQRREDLRTIQDPLSSSSDGSSLGDLEERLKRERDIIAEQYEEKRALLDEIAANDETIAQDQSLIEIELFRDKERAMTQLSAEGARERTQIQRDAALGIFNIAAKGLGSLIQNEEKAKRFQQVISKARALMAGVEAAEKARAFGATLGGLVGGSIAYGLSWAATLASVASIDSAASGGSGGSPGSVSGGSGGGYGATESSSNDLIRNTSGSPTTVNHIIVMSADELIDNEKFKAKALQAVADGTSDKSLIPDSSDPTSYRMNVA